jgi:hypothetical protein
VFVSSDNPPDLTIAGISPVADRRAGTAACRVRRLPRRTRSATRPVVWAELGRRRAECRNRDGAPSAAAAVKAIAPAFDPTQRPAIPSAATSELLRLLQAGSGHNAAASIVGEVVREQQRLWAAPARIVAAQQQRESRGRRGARGCSPATSGHLAAASAARRCRGLACFDSRRALCSRRPPEMPATRQLCPMVAMVAMVAGCGGSAGNTLAAPHRFAAAYWGLTAC